MAEANWTEPEAQADLVTGTNLDTLNDGVQIVIGDAEEVNNSVKRHFFMDVEVELVQVNLSGEPNPSIDLYLFAQMDGANYPDVWKSTADLVAVISVQATDATHRAVFRGIIIPPYKFKVCPVNSTGQNFTNDVNNHITYVTYSEEGN